MKYRIYIDEVGNPDLGSSDNPNHRFLSLTGVVIELEYVRNVIQPEMEALKAKYFKAHHPDEPVILHRKEMVNYKPPFEVLRDEHVRSQWDTEFLQLMKTWNYHVITVCLDKKKHKETYTAWRYDPYHYCLEVLLERYVLFLKRKNTGLMRLRLESDVEEDQFEACVGDVMAESIGGKEDVRLKNVFTGFWEKGTDYVSQGDFQKCLTSRQLKVKSKANNIAGLQLADLLAHPSRNEILHEYELLPGKIGPFAEQVIEILQTKYDKQGGTIYGKKFI